MTDTVDTSKEAVERLSPYAVDGGADAYGEMEPDCIGDYVRYEDYATLQTERDQLRREVEEARSVRGASKVVYVAWLNGYFENDADEALQDLIESGADFDCHDAMENWFSAIIKARP